MKKVVNIFVITVVFALFSIYGLNELSKSRSFQFFGGLVAKVQTSEKVVALTFDDGPGVNTDKILDILRYEGVKATFFLTGREIESNLDDAIKIAQDGHEIGNHSYSHSRMVLKPMAFIKDELEKTDALIRRAGYQGEILFRPPNSKRLVLLPYYLSRQNRKTILWNIEPDSYKEVASNEKKIVEHVYSKISPGSIILLHVMYENRSESLYAVRGIINLLRQEGYTFKTVSELLKY